MMKKIVGLALVLVMILSLSSSVSAIDKNQIERAIDKIAEFIYKTVKEPQVDSVGGEWAVIGLGRSGFAVSDSWYEGYYQRVNEYVRECGGVLHERKYTEYSRVILGLTAAGYEPQNVAGHDLTSPLSDFERTIWQGINGAIFALISLDSRDYPNPNRDKYIAEILRRQLDDGGFNLTAGSDGEEISEREKADPDITAMALQALAKYQDNTEVKVATNKALDCLSQMQNEDGGYTSWGEVNSESTAQVIVALGELGISFDDSRFVKNGITLIDNLMTFQNGDGSFRHTYDGTGSSQMSTEQAFYALVSVQRRLLGKSSLYRMNDVEKKLRVDNEEKELMIGSSRKHEDVKVMPIILEEKKFSDTVGHVNNAAIEALAVRGIINGKTDTEFDPDATMTRAEYAAIITRTLGLAAKEIDVFTDVDESSWYASFVGTAFSYGIVTGTSDTTFNPGGVITRQEAAVMTARAAKLCGMDIEFDKRAIRDILAQFGDYVTVASWAQSSLAFCYSVGILSDEEFDILPRTEIKRCEIAQMLYNLLILIQA